MSNRMLPRYYLKYLGGAPKVQALVGLAPSNYGTTAWGVATLLPIFAPWLLWFGGIFCPACTEQVAGSSFLQNLNAGGDTAPGVTYTVIQSRLDEVVTPYTNAFLRAPGVTNITLQDFCGQDFADHSAISYDHIAPRYVLNALDPAHPQTPVCSYVGWISGR